MDQAEQDVLGADVVVVEQARFFLRQDHDPPGPVGEAFEHVRPFQKLDDLEGKCTGASNLAAVDGSSWS